MNILKLFIAILIAAWTVNGSLLLAQESPGASNYNYDTYFRLMSNASFYAELIDIRGDTVEIELQSGNRIKFLQSQFKQIEAAKPESLQSGKSESEEKSHLFRDKKRPHFYHLSSGLIFGGSSSVILSGANMSFEYKYRWRPEHFLVGQVGADVFDGMFPTLSESLTLGYDWIKYTNRVNPFLSGRLGWGIGQYLSQEEVFWGNPPERSINGGYRARIGTGVIFTGNQHSAFTLGIDFIVQQFTHHEIHPDILTREIDILHRRIQFNIGYTF